MFNVYINDMLCYKFEIAQKYKKPITYYWFSLGFLLEEYCRLLNKCNIARGLKSSHYSYEARNASAVAISSAWSTSTILAML